MNPDSLRQLLKYLAEKAGVKKCYSHRFRHTSAITYLRSGGDVFTLQALLGHSTLEMVRHYSRRAEVDLANAHRLASPADHRRLSSARVIQRRGHDASLRASSMSRQATSSRERSPESR
jgi:hypothetical protein